MHEVGLMEADSLLMVVELWCSVDDDVMLFGDVNY